MRILSASVVLSPFAFPKLRKIKRSDWKYLVSVGFFGSFIPAFLFAIAQTRLQSSVVGVLNALTPIFTILTGMVFYSQRHHRKVFVGVGVGFVGTAILILTRVEGGFALNYYAFLIVLATIFYASNLNLIKQHLSGIHALDITSISLLIVGPLAAFYLFFMTDYPLKLQSGNGIYLSSFYIVILGVMGTAIALVIFNNLVQITNAVFTSSVTYIIPLIAVGWGLLDGEELVLMHYVGMTGIVTGVYIANQPRSKTRDKA